MKAGDKSWVKFLIIGLIVGLVLFGAFDLFLFNNDTLREKYVLNAGSGIGGYKVHHSFYALVGLVVGAGALFWNKKWGWIIIGFCVAGIIVHTIGDGRLVFIESVENYLKYAEVFR